IGGFDTQGATWFPYGVDLDCLMLGEFISSVAEGRVPQPDGDGGLRTLKIVTAAQKSVAMGQPVQCSGAR
ncbi:MAG: gfo/Idh/MocA family oxidoreductase, partial [Specibacter sp.]